MDAIVVKGAKILAQKTKEVPKELLGTKELEKMLVRMSKALRATEHGVAIAANQIAIPYRIFVVRGFVIKGKERTEGDALHDIAFINPRLIKLSRKKELMDEVASVLSRMPGPFAKALSSFFIDGKTQEEIAQEEGASVGAIKTRVHRAKAEFRKIYKQVTTNI